MQIRRCMKCMHELRADETVCPHCGREYGTSQAEHYALRPGTILEGKYLVGEMLGQGGFGITYIGFDLLLEQKVAIKEYFPMSTGMVTRDNQTTVVWSTAMMQKTGTEKGFESFLKEARKMARLGNIPGVVGVKTVFIENETAYIVMDYVEGETLLKKIQREGPMTFSQSVRLLTPIMEALDEVHQHGIIHRDISPDNIMVKQDGSLVLLDLGAAKDIAFKSSDGITQHSSQVVAKTGFSPLEQYSAKGNIGPWTDVYALCATIYYCCTSEIPPASMERVLGDTLSCRPLLHSWEFEVLRQGMNVQYQKRIQTMGGLLSALKPKQGKRKKKYKNLKMHLLVIIIVLLTISLTAAVYVLQKNEKSVEKRDDFTDIPAATSAPTMPAATAAETTAAETSATETSLPAREEPPQKEIPQLHAGESVYLGKYPRSEDTIQWDVLEVQGSKALLVSRSGLDCVPYNEVYEKVVWNSSTIRRWLNDTFLFTAFSIQERSCIDLTHVDNSASQGYSRWEPAGSEDTDDYIFLLSYAEAKKYFGISGPGTDGPMKARMIPTEYAVEQGAYVSDEYQTADHQYATRWWLRSPGIGPRSAACVHSRGCVGEQKCTAKDTCVRPAMWIDLEKMYR